MIANSANKFMQRRTTKAIIVWSEHIINTSFSLSSIGFVHSSLHTAFHHEPHHSLSPFSSSHLAKFPFCPRRQTQGPHHRRIGRRVRRWGRWWLETMGQETCSLFRSLRYNQDGYFADPRGDDETPHRTCYRIRQAPFRCSSDSGNHIFLIPLLIFFLIWS